MKIAVPLYKDRVSPHFGSAAKALLIETRGSRIARETQVDVYGRSPLETARQFVKMGVEEIICGGIQNYCKNWFTKQGVMIVDNQKGLAKEVARKILRSDAAVKESGYPDKNPKDP